jgi:predicted Ser/Thr protein kinase
MSTHAGARTTALRAGDPAQLGEYELVGRLGQGGMGTVYLARDPRGELVAVKVIRADLAADDEFRERFRREVQQARQVPPFCTAEVLDADPDHRTPYLVVEYVDGPCLADVIEERGPLSGGNLQALAIGVATALTAIHGAGVVHRDLKPRNVLLAPGSPKVIDFGIARAMEATSQLTRTNQMLGTVAYMAPERFDDHDQVPLGPAADVFAWGAVITYAATGRTPFGGDSPTATAGRILTQQPDLSGVPSRLRDLVGLSLQKHPADRPTARDLLDMLLGTGTPGAGAGAALAGQPELRDAARSAREGYEVTPSRPVATAAGPRSGRHVAGGRARSRAGGRAGAGGRRRWRTVAAVGAAVAVVAAGVSSAFDRWTSPTTPAVQPSAAPPPAGTLVFRDSLARETTWKAEKITQGSCTYRNTIYLVQLTVGGFYLCEGPTQRVAGDQIVSVDIILGRVATCASIFFLRDGDDYHELQTCQDVAVLNKHGEEDVDRLGSIAMPTPVPLGKPVRVTARIVGSSVEVSHDRQVVGRMPVDAAAVAEGGQITVGVYGDEDLGAAPFEAAFGHIEVRSLT